MIRVMLVAALLMIFCVSCTKVDQKDGKKTPGNGDGPPGVELERKGDALYRKGNQSFSLDYYKGKNPVIVVKVPKDSPAYQQFTQDVQTHQQALQKHGVVVVEIYGYHNGQFSGQIRGQRSLNTAEASDLNDSYGGSPNSRKMFLIGKDGTYLLEEKDKLDVAKAIELLEMQ